MSKQDTTLSSNRCFFILDPYFPIWLQKSTEIAKSGLYFSTVLSISCMYPGAKWLLERLMFRIPTATSKQTPCIENLERGTVGWGIPNASHLVSESQAQPMLDAHWVKKEMTGQKQALYRYQQLKAPTATAYIPYINSHLKEKLPSFSMREA